MAHGRSRARERLAAIREASVVIAALAAPRLLSESGGAARLGGAAAVFAGVAAIAAR
jgi:hypothetical protein